MFYAFGSFTYWIYFQPSSFNVTDILDSSKCVAFKNDKLLDYHICNLQYTLFRPTLKMQEHYTLFICKLLTTEQTQYQLVSNVTNTQLQLLINRKQLALPNTWMCFICRFWDKKQSTLLMPCILVCEYQNINIFCKYEL